MASVTKLATLATSSRTRTIAFWAVSSPIIAETVAGIQWDLARNEYVRNVFAVLQLPLYFLTILGIAKIFALVAFLVPGFPRLKEWTYAGLFFVYAGAAACHFAVDDPVMNILTPLGFAVLTLASWALRSPSRRDPAPLPDAWARLSTATRNAGIG
jgi:hypothetical protein